MCMKMCVHGCMRDGAKVAQPCSRTGPGANTRGT